MRSLLLLICLFSSTYGFAATVQDSTGVEEIDGKKYIIHRVEEKETLYSLSRKYDVPIYRIIEHNPPTEFGLEIGSTIRVPVMVRERKAMPEVDRRKIQTSGSTEKKNNPFKTHIVQEKQTLFSISRLYNVTIEELKAWNNLETNALEIGQPLVVRHSEKEETPVTPSIPIYPDQLHIVQPSETLYSLSRKYNVTIEELKEWNELVTNDISIGQQLVIAKPEVSVEVKAEETVVPDTVLAQPVERSPEEQEQIAKAVEAARKYEEQNQPVNFDEVTESGLAEVIEGTDETRKYLALHRTAKVGTILKVRNDMNDQEVFVRVLGKLPDTGSNQNVLIKLSKSAYNRLGAIDNKFRVTVTYIP